MSEIKCPKCGSTNIGQYRMPTGAIWCGDCGFRVEQKETGNPFINQQHKPAAAQRQAGREEVSNAEYVLRLISEPDPWYRDMNPKKQVESIRDRARKALDDLGKGRKG